MDDFEYSEGTRSTMQTTQGKWYWKEYGNVWRLDDAVQNEALELAGSSL
jgi:hypothetical protein